MKEIFINEYIGYVNKHENDVAILVLDEFIEYNNAVMPICLDNVEHLDLYTESSAVGTVSYLA